MFLRRWLTRGRQRQSSSFLREVCNIQFEITNYCNLNCSICWRSLRDERIQPVEIRFKDFKRALDKLLTVFSIISLNTQGLGEPMLCTDIVDILRYAKKKNISSWFVTNGTVITEFMARQLVDIGVDKIRFSVDSSDPVLYSEIKRGGRLEQVEEAIGYVNNFKKQFKKTMPRLAFNSVIFRKNVSNIEELINMAARLTVEEVSLIPMVVFSKGLSTAEQQVDFYSPGFKRQFALLSERAKGKNVELNLGISLESKESKFCYRGLYVDVVGFVRPCCNISSFGFGNIYKQDIGVIVRNYIRFREWLDRKDITCKECNIILDKR